MWKVKLSTSRSWPCRSPKKNLSSDPSIIYVRFRWWLQPRQRLLSFFIVSSFEGGSYNRSYNVRSDQKTVFAGPIRSGFHRPNLQSPAGGKHKRSLFFSMNEAEDEKKPFSLTHEDDLLPDPDETLMLNQGHGKVWLVKVCSSEHPQTVYFIHNSDSQISIGEMDRYRCWRCPPCFPTDIHRPWAWSEN